MANRAYPKPSRYFAPVTDSRPLFQGDIIRGAFGAFWRHPEATRSQMAGTAVPNPARYPTLSELTSSVFVKGHGYGMLLPHPCEFSEGEKGDTQPFRLVAPLVPVNREATVDPRRLRDGMTVHAMWVPRWGDKGPQDYYVDLRYASSIDATFVTRGMRVAALAMPAWVALADHLSRYFTGVPLDTAAFAATQALLHPDVA